MFKRKINWNQLLCTTSSRDYIFQQATQETQIAKIIEAIQDADCIIVGAGAGASAAAGHTYSGKRFTENFAEFIEKYGMTDMYSAGFYPFESEEAKWGYWSKHALFNGILPDALAMYKDLFEILKDKNYFILTTNVDHQFVKAGFDPSRVFATQGNYRKIQCTKGCHPQVYDATQLFVEMDKARKNCLIPTHLVPRCPVCHGSMSMHLRCDQYFVEDEAWQEACNNYAKFLKDAKGKKTIFLELGVGFNTPVIIRFPFEKMVKENKTYKLIRLNKDESFVPGELQERAIGLGGDMVNIIERIKESV